jgi:alcohol dehydrogenase (NADP+)
VRADRNSRYGTEPAVARGIKKSGVPRKDVFIVTKLWNNYHHPDDVEKACDLSLKDLETDYLDLYLMHWPSAFARSDSLFPDNRNGNIDYVDVSEEPSLSNPVIS